MSSIKSKQFTHCWGPPKGFGEQGNKAYYFRGTKGQKSKTEGNRGTKAILGNREHGKSRFWFWGTRENADFFQGSQGRGTPPNREGLIVPIILTSWYSACSLGIQWTDCNFVKISAIMALMGTKNQRDNKTITLRRADPDYNMFSEHFLHFSTHVCFYQTSIILCIT